MNTRATPLPKTRRYWRDEWHPYGWSVGFRESVILPNGKRVRIRFSDIGVDKSAAISNAHRRLALGDFLEGSAIR